MLIFAKLFDDADNASHEDFGVLVTRDNVERHLLNMRKQVKPYNSSPPLWEGRWGDNWIGRRAKCLLKNFSGKRLVFEGYVSQHTVPSSLIVTQGSRIHKIILDKAGIFSFSMEVAPGESDVIDIEFSVEKTFNPKSLGDSEDDRNLSVQLKLQGKEDL